MKKTSDSHEVSIPVPFRSRIRIEVKVCALSSTSTFENANKPKPFSTHPVRYSFMSRLIGGRIEKLSKKVGKVILSPTKGNNL